ncbi:hypothetical protein ACKI1I_02490 [Streptomyces turgidiscabies]|uniref:Uncharacterized protein n=1 Tax=Streptomyces turgidiscabies (strain Car8) TaxID=698760 RepID=L7FKZ5_STRT8|nr:MULTISPECIES: hypothetical protein [Streptomyces]ELP71330.1 hypothetical protein STRTUCAR8_05452 [Streptomyces turgidiscabies Car8]MDX3492234.1 hypothetical protein [Streptomyces turgidiscabies]GAQ69475.1 hypothetical protein T45_01200 [Streptomyces turgidiscabies]
MGIVVPLTLLLIVGAVASVVLLRRQSGAYAVPSGFSGMSGLDAEVEANRWVVRLGGSLAGLRPGADEAAAQALAEAAGRHRAARGQLATARTPAEYAVARQTAVEGLRYVRAARSALGLEPAPQGADGDADADDTNDGTARRLRGANGRFGVTA